MNQKLVVPIVSQHEELECVINDYLILIENSLDTLLQFNVKLTLNDLTFDHLFILVVSKTSATYPNEIDRLTIDFNRFIVKSRDGNNVEYIGNPAVMGRIRQKTAKLCGRIAPTVNSNANRTMTFGKPKDAPVKPVKPDILTETKNLINNVSTKSEASFGKRLVPNMIDNESIEEAGPSDESTNELGLERPFSTSIKTKSEELSKELSKESQDSDDIDIDQLKKQMDELTNLKKQEEAKLADMNKTYNKDYQNYTKYFDDLNDQKRFMRVDKERAEEKRRVYEANKRAYYMMADEIDKGELSEEKISPLFRDKYPIYRFMDEKGLLDQDDEYETFLRLFNELYPEDEEESSNDDWIPHNYHYLTDEQKEKYKSSKSRHKDEIEEFIEKNVEKKTLPPLSEILKQLGDSDDEVESIEKVVEQNNCNTDTCHTKRCSPNVCKSTDCKSNDCKSNDCKSNDCKSNDCKSNDCKSNDCKSNDCKSNDCSSDESTIESDDEELPKLDGLECQKSEQPTKKPDPNPMLDKLVSAINSCSKN